MRKNALLVILLLVVCVGFLYSQGQANVAGNNQEQTEVSQTEENVSVTAGNTPVKEKEVTAYNKWVHNLVKDMESTNLTRVFFEAGVFAWVILAVFLISILLFGIRYYQLMIKEKLDSDKFHLKVKGLVKSNSIKEAISAAELVQRTSMGQIYRIGLLAYRDAKESGKKGDSLKEEVQNAFNEASYQTIPEIDRGLHWFDLLAQSSTYLGLLGTIMGLIAAFSGISETEVLMGGIKQAMGTTALGLIGAIAIQFIKGFLSSRAEKIINDLDANSVKIMNVINNQIQE